MSTSLLILCSPLNHLQTRLRHIVRTAIQHTGRTLYVQLEPFQTYLWPLNNASILQDAEFKNNCGNFIAQFYKRCHYASQTLDVRFLLNNLKHPGVKDIHLSKNIDVVLLDVEVPKSALDNYLKFRFHASCFESGLVKISIPCEDDLEKQTNACSTGIQNTSPKKERVDNFQNVVLGGTFDRLHGGHKILLTDAIVNCWRQLTIGITDGPMIKKKTLWELIEPIDIRINNLSSFLYDVDGSLQYEIEAITDPFGPSIEDPDLQCIVVSEETLIGGHRVNDERKKKHMTPLHIRVVNVIADKGHDSVEEPKISSSSFRMRSLGTRRNLPLVKPYVKNSPYVIGLTGGIASGKSAIAKRLKNLGAGVINCDKLGHLSYSFGSPTYHRVVERFGQDIVNSDGTINRKVLGTKVFANKAHLNDLNAIVWPEIKRLVNQQVQGFAEGGTKVVVVEAAVLLEAGWQDMAQEIWACIIPEDEAIRRMQQRDGSSEKLAKQKIENQMTNTQRITHANVVFCTAWDPNYTQKQVEKAWNGLNEYLEQFESNSNCTQSTL